MAETFTITDQHLALMRRMYVDYDEYTEYGAPEIDPKRPYGNSDVDGDICEILGWPIDGDEGPTREQEDAAHAIHREMATVLQIVLRHQTFEPRTYTRDKPWAEWEPVT